MISYDHDMRDLAQTWGSNKLTSSYYSQSNNRTKTYCDSRLHQTLDTMRRGIMNESEHAKYHIWLSDTSTVARFDPLQAQPQLNRLVDHEI